MAHLSVSYTETVEPVHVPKRPSSKIPIPCHSEKLKLLSSFQDTWKWWNISTHTHKSFNVQKQHVTIRIVRDMWKFNCNVQAKGWQVTHCKNSVSIVKTCELYSGISKSTTRSHKCVKTAHCSPASQCPGSIHKQEVEWQLPTSMLPCMHQSTAVKCTSYKRLLKKLDI